MCHFLAIVLLAALGGINGSLLFRGSDSNTANPAKKLEWKKIRAQESDSRVSRHPHGQSLHVIPNHVTARAHLLANEFQLLENIDTHIDPSPAYRIDSVSPRIIKNNDVVTVTYSCDDPTYGDFIAAYSPIPKSNADLSLYAPIKYGWADESSTYYSEGTGSLRFNFTNMRDDIAFYYFSYPSYSDEANTLRYTNKAYLRNSSDETVSFQDPNQPLRARVVATGDNNNVTVMWSANSSVAPTLKWGLIKGGPYPNISTARIDRIRQDEVCGYPAYSFGWRDLGEIYLADMFGINQHANQRIYYIFGDEESATGTPFSPEHAFLVPPLPGTQPPDRGTRVILYDDLGRGSTDDTYTWSEYGRPATQTLEYVGAEVAAGTVDAIYHGGDISYATGYLSVWDFFMNQVSPVASGTTYLTTVGNHESDWPNTATTFSGRDSGGECGVLATRLLPMPSPAVKDEPWWSYDVGLIHMVGMSTEHDFTIGSPQYKFIEADLASVNRTITPWIIFGGHRAMYINSNYGGKPGSDITVMDDLVANIEPLLFKYRVNIGFYGHNHVVQRHSAVYQQKVVQRSELRYDSEGNKVFWQEDPQATVQFVFGTGGAGFTPNAMSGDEQPVWNEGFFYDWGYARAEAISATSLKMDWISSTSGAIRYRMQFTQADDLSQPWVASQTDEQEGDSNNSLPTSSIVLAVVFSVLGALIAIFGYRKYVASGSVGDWVSGSQHGNLNRINNPLHPLYEGEPLGA